MRMNAVAAAVRNRNGNVKHFFDLGFKRPRCHHLFDTLPSAGKRLRIVRECAPKITDEIGLPCLADVSEGNSRIPLLNPPYCVTKMRQLQN